ncbi:MAG: RNA polymerase sigma factor [Dehalococcoidia bacterium]
MATESSNAPPPDPEFESFLVEQAKAGESEVWEHWFDQYYQQLYSYAFLRTRRKVDAEDIVAQVMLEAVKGIGRYEYRGRPIVAWLFAIAHNLIADSIKRQQRRETREADAIAAGGPSDADPESRIENLDLLQALDTLTEEQRDVVILRFFMGLRPKEIGDLLSKSEAAVYSLQARAILALRASMGDVPSI